MTELKLRYYNVEIKEVSETTSIVRIEATSTSDAIAKLKDLGNDLYNTKYMDTSHIDKSYKEYKGFTCKAGYMNEKVKPIPDSLYKDYMKLENEKPGSGSKLFE